jgi:hypothetical protein
MNWFNKHLNWTYVIINVVIMVIGIIVIFGLVSDSLRSFIDNPGVFPVKLIVPILISSGILSLVSVATSAWVLSRKGQSLLWLLLVLVSSFVLFILVLVLPNKHGLSGNVPGDKGKISDSEYYKSRGADVE